MKVALDLALSKASAQGKRRRLDRDGDASEKYHFGMLGFKL